MDILRRSGRNIHSEPKTEEIIMALRCNDVVYLEEMLALIYPVHENKYIAWCSPEHRKLAQIILGTAFSMVHKNDLKDDLAYLIIKYMSRKINLFDFLLLVYFDEKNNTVENFNTIPIEIHDALIHNEYSSEIATAIKSLDNETFRTLLVFILKKIDQISNDFTLPILVRVYKDRTIFRHQTFAYMGFCLFHKTIDDVVEEKLL